MFVDEHPHIPPRLFRLQLPQYHLLLRENLYDHRRPVAVLVLDAVPQQLGDNDAVLCPLLDVGFLERDGRMHVERDETF